MSQCEHREWTDGDEFFASGERCEATAEYRDCGEGTEVCAAHACRCKIRLDRPRKQTAAEEIASLRAKVATLSSLLAETLPLIANASAPNYDADPIRRRIREALGTDSAATPVDSDT